MKIGIIGTGNVGGTLGRRFAELGHAVAFGTRRPDSVEAAGLGKLPNSRVVSQVEAAASSDVVVLATPWPVTEVTVRGLGKVAGKVLLDCTNPLTPTFDALEIGFTTSAGEKVAEWAPGARVVKIFNTIGYNIMENPDFGGQKATLLYCGDDEAAKETARDLAAQLGFDPVDVGPLRQARLLEPFAVLWITMAFAGHGREIAFHLMRR